MDWLIKNWLLQRVGLIRVRLFQARNTFAFCSYFRNGVQAISNLRFDIVAKEEKMWIKYFLFILELQFLIQIEKLFLVSLSLENWQTYIHHIFLWLLMSVLKFCDTDGVVNFNWWLRQVRWRERALLMPLRLNVLKKAFLHQNL